MTDKELLVHRCLDNPRMAARCLKSHYHSLGFTKFPQPTPDTGFCVAVSMIHKSQKYWLRMSARR